MASVVWNPYKAEGSWAARYRVMQHWLEVELETVSRQRIEGGFAIDFDKHLPPGFGLDPSRDQIEVSVVDSFIDRSIFMGSKVPGYWKRTVSMIVHIHPDKVIPCA